MVLVLVLLLLVLVQDNTKGMPLVDDVVHLSLRSMEEEVTEYKQLNIYMRPSIVEKEAVIKVTGAKDIQMEYSMHVFTCQDFWNMTSLTVWWEDWKILNLMRQRHWKYPDYYDPRDRILDLNFYMNFLHRYNQMSDEATMLGGKSMSQLLDDFVWDDDMIDYVWGIRPTPGGLDWIDAKSILGNRFMIVEILLHEGL
ncbi:hypothetical protein EJD97_015539, partial [Solanum chilense]